MVRGLIFCLKGDVCAGAVESTRFEFRPTYNGLRVDWLLAFYPPAVSALPFCRISHVRRPRPYSRSVLFCDLYFLTSAHSVPSFFPFAHFHRPRKNPHKHTSNRLNWRDKEIGEMPDRRRIHGLESQHRENLVGERRYAQIFAAKIITSVVSGGLGGRLWAGGDVFRSGCRVASVGRNVAGGCGGRVGGVGERVRWAVVSGGGRWVGEWWWRVGGS